MSKFRIKLKLTGLELEIEGSRDEMPQIARNLGQQFSGLLQPAAGIVTGEVTPDESRSRPTAPALAPSPAENGNGAGPAKRKGARKRKAAANGTGSASAAPAVPADLVVEFGHDPTKYGTPKQEWSTVQKALWLLYVVREQSDRRELTAHQIEATFNRHFREAGQILVQYVARDLGKQRAKGKDATVAEDNTMEPSPWFLTEVGQRAAQDLVAQALGRAGAGDPGLFAE